MTATVLPRLVWHGTPNRGQRFSSHPLELVVVHRWGVRVTTETAEATSYQGTVNWLSNPASQVSSHLVFPGSAVPGEATQMVGWQDYAWAEAAYNPVAVEVESADAIWVPMSDGTRDSTGMAVLARIVAFLLASGGGLHDPKTRVLPAVWSTNRGFCRHADLGAAGGGHTSCPTTDIGLWRHFVSLVQAEYARAGFRPAWGWSAPPAV